MTPEEEYVRLGQLLAAMPELRVEFPLSAEANLWLGRATALADKFLEESDRKDFRQAANLLVASPDKMVADAATHALTALLFRALAAAELKAPSVAQGAFISAGNSFDAVAAIGRVLGDAQHRILIVDPYMDEKALIDFAVLAREGVAIHLLADQKDHKPGLKPAAERWKKQYDAMRPLEVRFAKPRTLHDRLLIVDDEKVSVLTQSLNAFASRSPASIVRVDQETAILKIAAYEEMWKAAEALK